MFDGEDALGQISTMSLDNQRNLKLGIHDDDLFLKVAGQVAGEIDRWAEGFLGRRTIADWRQQLGFTTRIFRPRGLHLDDRHVRNDDGSGFSASIVDAALYVGNNGQRLRDSGSSSQLTSKRICFGPRRCRSRRSRKSWRAWRRRFAAGPVRLTFH